MALKFLDAFAGIGGFRIGLEAVGAKCVETIENDRFCLETYHEWFPGSELHCWPTDINDIDPVHLRDFDIMCAGFPCQPFSQAGVSKRQSMGRPHGFDDLEKGNLFFNLMNIIRTKRPKVVLLENVRNLILHDKGNTWKVIQSTLHDAQYFVKMCVIDAAAYVPQRRQRVYIVAFRSPVAFQKFQFPTGWTFSPHLYEILEDEPDEKYTLSDKLWKYLQDYRAKHKAAGNGFGYTIADVNLPTRTLSARYGKDGSEILIAQKGKNPRKLTPRECARLMGFPDHLPIVVSDTQAYKQFGNAVVPPVVHNIALGIVEALDG